MGKTELGKKQDEFFVVYLAQLWLCCYHSLLTPGIPLYNRSSLYPFTNHYSIDHHVHYSTFDYFITEQKQLYFHNYQIMNYNMCINPTFFTRKLLLCAIFSICLASSSIASLLCFSKPCLYGERERFQLLFLHNKPTSLCPQYSKVVFHYHQGV